MSNSKALEHFKTGKISIRRAQIPIKRRGRVTYFIPVEKRKGDSFLVTIVKLFI